MARLIEGHDNVSDDDRQTDKQKDLQEQILALLDPDESPDPRVLRQSLAHLLQGSSKTRVQAPQKLAHFFQDEKPKPVKPPRRLKGLDVNSIKVPDFSSIFDDSADTDATVVKNDAKKSFSRSPSTESANKIPYPRSSSIESGNKFTRSSESPLPQKGRRLSEVIDTQRRHSQSPEVKLPYKRSNSIGSTEMANTKRIAQLFEGHKRRHTPSPDSRSTRSGSVTNPEMALRLQRMTEIIEGKRRDTPSPERTKRETIGNPEMAVRRQKVVDLIKQGQGLGQEHRLRQPEVPLRRNSDEMTFRMQRVSDMMQRRSAESKKPKSGRRKAAREIMKQRFEKSLQMLAAEPRLDFAPSADLENDYGLQQYRASAPVFEERVKKLEKKLQHYVRRLPLCVAWNDPFLGNGDLYGCERLRVRILNSLCYYLITSNQSRGFITTFYRMLVSITIVSLLIKIKLKS